MGIICPLVEIGLTDLEKSGGAYGTPRSTPKDDIPDDVVVFNSGYDVLFESNLRRGVPQCFCRIITFEEQFFLKF